MQRSLRPTWAEVDLDAVAHNIDLVKELVAPAGVCAVIKAFAYGHGLVRIAETAARAGVSYLGVALPEEGRAVRQAGLDIPILVLSEPVVDAMDEVVYFSLTPTLYTYDAIESMARVAAREKHNDYPVHLKVDTGMNRVGVPFPDAADVARMIRKQPSLDLEGVFTHFAGAELEDDSFTRNQFQRFSELTGSLEQESGRPKILHAANSAAAMKFPETRLDMVRIGIAMYGISPAAALASALPLRPAMSLKSQVLFVKKVPAGESVSYGMEYQTPTETVIATVPAGYSDGVPRRLGLAGGEVLINGKRCRIAGAVTMDQTIVDCGPNAEVAVGDEVVFLGTQDSESITAWEWAQILSDSPYVMISGISSRVPRRYVRGHSS